MKTLHLYNKIDWSLEAGDQVGKQKRRFDMLAYTGAVFDVGFGPAVIDLAGMETPATLAILRQHDPNQYVGRADKIEKGEKLRLQGYLFDIPEAHKIAEMSDQGAEWQASVGINFEIDDLDYVSAESEVEVNGTQLQGPFLIIRRSVLKEASFVPLGADPHTSALALADAVGARLEDLRNNKQKEAPVATPDPVAIDRERIKAIQAEFADDPQFALEAAASGLSLMEAKAKYADRLKAKLAQEQAEKDKKIADLEARLAAASTAHPAGQLSGGSMGGSPSGGETADPIEQWNSALAAECDRLMKLGSAGLQRTTVTLSREANVRAQAVANLAARHPDMHRAFLEAHNARRAMRQGR